MLQEKVNNHSSVVAFLLASSPVASLSLSCSLAVSPFLCQVMPFLPRPLLLTDFLLTSYTVGGAISLLALASVFTLISKHNLEFPEFYSRLYQLFTAEVGGNTDLSFEEILVSGAAREVPGEVLPPV